MGTNYKEVGGGPATGLADSLVQLLQSGLSGNFSTGGGGTRSGGPDGFGGQPSATDRFAQADPMGRTQGVMGWLNDILAGGAGKLGGSINDLFQKQTTRDVGDIRARYGASGGMSLGTPGATAEALYRSDAAPKGALAIGNLQSSILMPLLQMAMGLAGKGISQRSTVASPSVGSQILSTVGQVAGAAAPFLVPGMNVSKYLGGLAPDVSGFDGSALPQIPLWSPN